MARLDEMRQCCKCGEKFVYRDLIYQFQRRKMIAKVGRGLIREIWRNPIFILECCFCYTEIPSPNRLRSSNII